MDGQLAQLIALVGYGNAYLSGDEERAPNLSDSNSTFQYVGALKFARYQDVRATQGAEIATDTSAWFERLRSEGAKRLWYVAFAWNRQDSLEHQAVAFGAVPRAIQIDYPTAFELWYPVWSAGDVDTPNNKVWGVEYKALPFDYSQAVMPDLQTVRVNFRQKLEAVKVFSERVQEGAEPWTAWFTEALRLLDAADPRVPFHGDMLPQAGYDLTSRQLLAAAAQGNVFGGMGSWNDLGFSDEARQSEYIQVSRELYEAVKISFVAAVNAYQENV